MQIIPCLFLPWTTGFILKVKKHNIYYDTKHPSYENSVRKETAWGLIAKVLDVDATELAGQKYSTGSKVGGGTDQQVQCE